MNKIKEKFSRWIKSENFMGSAVCALIIGLIIAFNAIVYTITVANGLYLYSPNTDDLTISSSADTLFADAIEESKETGEKVRIVFCRTKSQFDPASSTYADDETNKFYITAKQFEEKYPELIELAYINLLTKRMTVGDSDKEELIDLTEYQVKNESDPDNEYYPLYNSSVVFKSSNPEREKRYIQDVAAAAFILNSDGTSYSAYNGEEIVVSMVMWVLADEHKTAYFTTHHGETADVAFANMLTCAGYSIEMLDLKKVNKVPDGADLIVISNPIKDFEISVSDIEGSGVESSVYSEIAKLERYVNEGGNLYVALDPYVKKLHVLEEFLAEHGISFAEREDGKLRHIVKDEDNAITPDGFTLVADFANSESASKLAESVKQFKDEKNLSVILRESAALVVDSDLAEPILVSSGASSLYEGDKRVGDDGNYCLGALAKKKNDEGAESKIFVLSSVYITANDALYQKGYSNRDFLYSVFDNVFGMEDVPYGCAPVYRRDTVLENLTMKSARIYTVCILAIPVALAAVGAVITIKRKNR